MEASQSRPWIIRIIGGYLLLAPLPQGTKLFRREAAKLIEWAQFKSPLGRGVQ